MTGPSTSEFTEDPEPLLVLPEPEVRATELEDDKIPGGAMAVVKVARKHGFAVHTTYARGPWQHATHQTFVIKQSVRVVGVKGKQWFAATWLAKPGEGEKWTFNTSHIGGMTGLKGSDALRDFIKGAA